MGLYVVSLCATYIKDAIGITGMTLHQSPCQLGSVLDTTWGEKRRMLIMLKHSW